MVVQCAALKATDPNAVKLRAAIRFIHADIHATYGSRRMRDELNAQGFAVGRYKVRSLMQAQQLKAKRPKQHRYPVAVKPSTIAPNSLNLNLIQASLIRIGQVILLTFAR